jgi:hypothetical protein
MNSKTTECFHSKIVPNPMDQYLDTYTRTICKQCKVVYKKSIFDKTISIETNNQIIDSYKKYFE